MEEDARNKEDGSTTYNHSLYDSLIYAEVLSPNNDKLSKAIVKGRHINEKRDVTGQYDINSLLNSITYNVEFADGIIKECATNVITQNIYVTMSDD